MTEKETCEKNSLEDKRILTFVAEEIDMENAMELIEQLINLELENSDPITLIINTYGGCVDASFAIYDCIRSLRSKVKILCVGVCMSGGTLIATAADELLSFPHTSFLLHPMSIWMNGEYGSLDKFYKDTYKINDNYMGALAKRLGMTLEECKDFIKHDERFRAEEMVELGFVDRIVENFRDI